MNSIFHKSPALAMKISKDSLASKKSYKGRRLYYIYIYIYIIIRYLAVVKELP